MEKETAPDYKKKIKRKRKRRLTRQEKEYRVQHIEKKIETDKHRLNPMLSEGLEHEKWLEKEIRQQERDLRDLYNHSETFENDGYLICRLCGVKLKDLKSKGTKEKFIDLFCTHQKTIEKGDFMVCTKCGAEFKKKID